MAATPGHWKFSSRNWRGEEDPSGNLYVTGDHHDGVSGPTCTAVAVVSGNATSAAVTLANAQLVIAGPDLLAACQSLVELADGDGIHILPVMRRIREAIAKATGQKE